MLLLILHFAASQKLAFSLENNHSFTKQNCKSGEAETVSLCAGECVSLTLHSKQMTVLVQGEPLRQRFFCYSDLEYDYLVALGFQKPSPDFQNSLVLLKAADQIQIIRGQVLQFQSLQWTGETKVIRLEGLEYEAEVELKLSWQGLGLPFPAHNFLLQMLQQQSNCVAEAQAITCDSDEVFYESSLRVGSLLIPLSVFSKEKVLLVRLSDTVELGSLLFSHFDVAVDFVGKRVGVVPKAGSPVARNWEDRASSRRLVSGWLEGLVPVAMAALVLAAVCRGRRAPKYQQLE